MKRLLIYLINLYQIVISPLLRQLTGISSSCRYNPTCSEYAKEQVMKKGVLLGVGLSVKRLMSCHPFAKISHPKYNYRNE